MTCYHPIKAWQKEEGAQLVFVEPREWLGNVLRVPCQKCIGCKIQYSQTWGTRMVHEGKMHKNNCFITLSYDEKHIPDRESLIKTAFPKFIRKLRQKNSGKTIRYYHCGEYGEDQEWKEYAQFLPNYKPKLGRPHYHAIIFNHDFERSELFKSTAGGDLFISNELSDLWGKGFCSVAELNQDTAQYVARYVTQKKTGEQAIEKYKRVCPITAEIHPIQPEYSSMSLKPGIGYTFWEKYRREIINNDSVFHMAKGKVKIAKVPKYYDTQLEKNGCTGQKPLG